MARKSTSKTRYVLNQQATFFQQHHPLPQITTGKSNVECGEDGGFVVQRKNNLASKLVMTKFIWQ